jgi:hypothetical protein
MRSLKVSTIYLLALELALLFLLCSCPQHTHKPGTFSETSMPLSGANSEYDDFNSMPPPGIENFVFPFYFSSNRTTQGGSFDIENFSVNVQLDEASGAVSVSAYKSEFPSPWQSLNSASNEFGPYYVDIAGSNRLYMFASDRNGNLDIFHANDGIAYPSVALNSSGDDAYPSLSKDNIFYFSSNRSGNYDIYSAPVPTDQSIVGFLEGTVASIAPVDSVNSTWDDKAPYINGKLMIFASNRPGGYGGYDLWYSTYGDSGWSQPINFGSNINTSSDEFRPVVIDTSLEPFTNDLMIFSSNRPGGLGGFDLYCVGIPRLTQ